LSTYEEKSVGVTFTAQLGDLEHQSPGVATLREKQLGMDHPDTLHSMYGIAYVYAPDVRMPSSPCFQQSDGGSPKASWLFFSDTKSELVQTCVTS
jgi:hypothetical protein